MFEQNIFCSKFWWLRNQFFESRFELKIFIENVLVENFLWLQNHFLENRFEPKIFIENFLVENFLWLQNHFLENRFKPKIFIGNFSSKYFYGCKIISSKTGSTKNFHQKIFVENLLSLQNHFPEIRLETKIFIKIFFLKIFYCCKIISSRKGMKLKFHQKFFGPKFLIIAKSFPRKQVRNQNFH